MLRHPYAHHLQPPPTLAPPAAGFIQRVRSKAARDASLQYIFCRLLIEEHPDVFADLRRAACITARK